MADDRTRATSAQDAADIAPVSAFPLNRAGMARYEKFGFRTVGIYREPGLLDDAWVDTIIMEKRL